jgi:protease I
MVSAMPSALLIIARQGFQDIELAGTRKGLLDAGFEVILASTEAGECTGKFGGKEMAKIALKDVNVAEYDRIGYIGGPGAHTLKEDGEARRIAQDTVKAGKPLGAICIAPTILAAAGVLQGKKATVWNEDGEQKGFLESHGAAYTGEPVTVDGLIVTGNGPEAAEEFGRVFAGLQKK